LLHRFVRIEVVLDSLWRAPLRTVAIAQERAIGAGADLFAACDCRLLALGAQFRFPGVAFGIVLGTRRLAMCVGPTIALRWVSEAATIDACAALAAGLTSAVLEGDVPNDQFTTAAEATAILDALASPAVERHTLVVLRSAAGYEGADKDSAALVRSAAPQVSRTAFSRIATDSLRCLSTRLEKRRIGRA